MRDFDIVVVDRSWTAAEMALHDELPGKLEMIGGKLCLDNEQRLLLLGALLEHVETARAVSLGPLHGWKAAIEQRQGDEAWDRMPAVGGRAILEARLSAVVVPSAAGAEAACQEAPQMRADK